MNFCEHYHGLIWLNCFYFPTVVLQFMHADYPDAAQDWNNHCPCDSSKIIFLKSLISANWAAKVPCPACFGLSVVCIPWRTVPFTSPAPNHLTTTSPPIVVSSCHQYNINTRLYFGTDGLMLRSRPCAARSTGCYCIDRIHIKMSRNALLLFVGIVAWQHTRMFVLYIIYYCMRICSRHESSPARRFTWSGPTMCSSEMRR